MATSIPVVPIGTVRSQIREAADDIWGGTICTIELDATRFSPDSLAGLDAFSHVEVVFVFDRVSEREITVGARHPRGRTDWPRVGIFAQRGKNRPNRMGVTICRLVAVRGTAIDVEALDAIDGTPVVDIKPYLIEFAPKGPVRQPDWATALMSGYWEPESR